MVGTFLEKLIEGTLDILQGSDNGDLTLPKSLERCEVSTNAPLF